MPLALQPKLLASCRSTSSCALVEARCSARTSGSWRPQTAIFRKCAGRHLPRRPSEPPRSVHNQSAPPAGKRDHPCAWQWRSGIGHHRYRKSSGLDARTSTRRPTRPGSISRGAKEDHSGRRLRLQSQKMRLSLKSETRFGPPKARGLQRKRFLASLTLRRPEQICFSPSTSFDAPNKDAQRGKRYRDE